MTSPNTSDKPAASRDRAGLPVIVFLVFTCVYTAAFALEGSRPQRDLLMAGSFLAMAMAFGWRSAPRGLTLALNLAAALLALGFLALSIRASL